MLSFGKLDMYVNILMKEGFILFVCNNNSLERGSKMVLYLVNIYKV